MIGREEQLNTLTGYYESDKNNLSVLYGRYGIGKTELIKEFIKDKSHIYFHAAPSVAFEMINSFNRVIKEQFPDYKEASGYQGIFSGLTTAAGNRLLLVIEDFQHIVKVDDSFMEAVAALVRTRNTGLKVMVILTSSSVSWIENSMVKTIGMSAMAINAFIKLKELDYSDMVSLYPKCSTTMILHCYGVTGGVPLYLNRWNPNESTRDNICRLFLRNDGIFRNEAENFIKDEFRESSVYNTILKCIATGLQKLNEIHEYTGFGRDKISVYLKNLIEREIVEKVFSYDAGGNELTRKGLYRIKDDFINFWFRFVYPYAGLLNSIAPEEFYDRYIAPGFDEYMQEAFIKVAGEFLEIMSSMGRLKYNVERKGRWYGKTGDIHLIFEDEAGNGIVGQAYTGNEPVTLKDLETLKENVNLAGINAGQYYLFSSRGFSEEIMSIQDDDLVRIRIEDL